MIEITGLNKSGGPLTKRLSLSVDGAVHSDGSSCIMSDGTGKRTAFDSLRGFAAYIGSLNPEQAIALGALRSDLPDQVQITTKKRLGAMNGSAALHVIARTADFITYRPDRPALALIDIDTKGMPPIVAARIRDLGGYWSALIHVVPELAQSGHVFRRSTSTGISRADTGAPLAGSSGYHVYILVQDGADIERCLRTLHNRCWLHGFGWLMVGAGGQLLDRSIVDRMVYAPERLVFEGAPVLDPPLVQDTVSRQATAHDGAPLDTLAACTPLRIVDQAKLAELKAKEAYRLTPERAKAREKYVGEQTERITKRTGCTIAAARRTALRQCDGVLLPDVILPFDVAEFSGCTVADVLADPDRFVGATLADPLEGPDYGRCCAKILRRADGAMWINSFAHGRTTYELKHGAASIESILAKVPDAELVARFTALVIGGDIDDHDRERLRDIVHQRSGIGKRTIDRTIAAERDKHADQQAQEAAQQRVAERRDPRPQITAPAPDAPWLPQMEVLNDVLGRSTAPEPPMRDLSGTMTEIRLRRAPDMHALSALGSNAADTDETRLPAPEQLLLTRLNDVALSELIERHVDYVDNTGRSVHLAAPFVRHFLVRHDNALPLVTAVATLPMVLPDGTILAGQGLNRKRGIVFRVPAELQALLPEAKDCTPTQVADAMRYLTDDWLVDVAASYTGKCVLIAIAATVLERHVLPERPAGFVSAGQRGGGKTTVANMISVAALGSRAAAAAWSANDEERRKSLLAYLGEGVPLICWDNIPRGTSISCPSIEKALTAAIYQDRILGASEFRSVPATSVHLFTGNNVGPKGDLASRSLLVRLAVDRPDPENREFRHPDPIGWTEANRGRILQALYTILLGNTRLTANRAKPAETRFKLWWHLVGAAIEHAAQQHAEHVDRLVMDADKDCKPEAVSFRNIFLEAEAEEEQTTSLNTVLDVLRSKWPGGVKALTVATYAGAADEGAIEFRAALEQASGKLIRVMTPTVMTWRLKAIADAPVTLAKGDVVALRYEPDETGHGGDFIVREIRR